MYSQETNRVSDNISAPQGNRETKPLTELDCLLNGISELNSRLSNVVQRIDNVANKMRVEPTPPNDSSDKKEVSPDVISNFKEKLNYYDHLINTLWNTANKLEALI